MKPNPREILSSIAAEAGERIIDVLGEGVVRTIFVTGSLPRGEIAWFDRGDTVEIYSDVDISVVVADDAAWEEARNRARRAVREVAREGKQFELLRTIDVGVYVLGDLLAQPARPGTVDIPGSHLLLYGDAEIPMMMKHHSSSSIDPTEALYLLENRLIERTELFDRIQRDNRTGLERYAVYAAHKTCADAASAALIVAKRYSSDTDARRRALMELHCETDEDNPLSTQDIKLINGSMRALEDLQHAITNEKKSYEEVWRDIESFTLALWRRLSSRVLKIEGDADWITLISKRCRHNDTLDNIRSFSRLARRKDYSRARSIIMGAGNRRFSPIDALRLSGLVQCALQNPQAGSDEKGLAKEFVPYMDRITRLLGRGEGDVFARARRLYRELN